MLRKKFRILFIVFSLVGCATGAKERVAVCVSDPGRGGFDCIDPHQKHFFLKYEESNNYISFSPDEFNKIAVECVERK